jgi:Xaa-Pro aminopeptidase
MAGKTPEEIAAIEETQRATTAAMEAVISYLRSASVPTSEEAHALIDKILLEHDCESPTGHIVAGGLQATEPHERGTGPISRGVAIVIDIFPRNKKTGYFADMTRTICLGEPSPHIQKMFDAVVGAQEFAESLVRPGAACGAIQEAVEKFFSDRGFETSGKGKEFAFAEGFVHGVGHGVGLQVHEAPRIGRKSEDVLAEGDVITIEPGLYYPEWGGVRMEDMVLVAATGSRNLAQFSKQFIQ